MCVIQIQSVAIAHFNLSLSLSLSGTFPTIQDRVETKILNYRKYISVKVLYIKKTYFLLKTEVLLLKIVLN